MTTVPQICPTCRKALTISETIERWCTECGDISAPLVTVIKTRAIGPTTDMHKNLFRFVDAPPAALDALRDAHRDIVPSLHKATRP